MTIGDQPAFPRPSSGPGHAQSQSGMTYRQWLVGQIAAGAVHGDSNDTTAKWVVNMADAIIKRLEEK